MNEKDGKLNKLFIGMPVFNGERFIENALKSICAQTFKNWEMLISDNCSTDKTAEICAKFVKLDNRISYFRHSENIGASKNFKYLLDIASNEYFMWAGSDDEWDPRFISSGIDHLEKDEKCGMAFSNFINTDSFGRQIRSYPNFERFSSSHDKNIDIINYLLEPEALGKANLIYGIYRLELCRKAWSLSPFGSNLDIWGGDYIFNLALISIANIMVDNRVLFRKRSPHPEDALEKAANEISILNPWENIFPHSVSTEYRENILKLIQGMPIYELTSNIMNIRSQISEKNDELSKIRAIVEKLLGEKGNALDQVENLKAENSELKKKVDQIKNLIPVRVYLKIKRFLRG